MSETKYPEGIRTFKKNDKQPDFVLGSVVITLNELVTFCKSNPYLLTEYNGQKQLRLQCVKKRDGGITFTVDTFKPTKQEPKPEKNEEFYSISNDSDLPLTNDLPF